MDSRHLPGGTIQHGRALGLFLWLGIIFLAGCLAPPVIVLWWLLDDTAPLAGPAGRFLRWDAHDPGVAIVEWRAVRNRSCPGMAYRWLIGDLSWELDAERVPYAGSTETFGDRETRWLVPVRIPAAAFADEWPMAYRVSFEWACNPLQAWVPIKLQAPDIEIPAPPGTPPGVSASPEDRPR